MGEVIYGVFDNSMWELHLRVDDMEGNRNYVMLVRCNDEKFPELISRRINELDKNYNNYRVYLDSELVHETNYR
tara:strand:- start:1877 stop:2098 length:222 start_codon:yes stop_codon:yes gene_type:complete